ncbi:MAG: glycosyltransferase family 39 protein [Planctomycetota bacterium]
MARPAHLVLGLLVLGQGTLLSTHFAPALASTDAHCYHVAARQLARSGTLAQHPADPLRYVGLLWVENETGDLFPKHAPLYPLLAAAAERCLGHDAGLYVNPCLAPLTTLLAYVAARAAPLPRAAALLSAAVIATHPVGNAMAVDQLAHPTSTALLTGAFALFLRGRRRPRARWSFAACGVLLGLATATRYPNALLLLPVAAWAAAAPRRRAVRLLSFAVGAAMPMLPLALYHWQAFGAPWRTGYALTAEQTSFSFAALQRHAGRYASGILTYSGPAALLALGGWIALSRRRPLHGAWFTLWIGPIMVLYAAYYHAPETQPLRFLRFLAPLHLPIALLAGAAVAGTKHRRAALVGAGVILAAWPLPISLQTIEHRYEINAALAARTAQIRNHVSAGTTIFATHWVQDELGYFLHGATRLYEAELLDRAVLARALPRRQQKRSIQPRRLAALSRLLDAPAEHYSHEIERRLSGSLAPRPVLLVGNGRARAAFARTFGDRYCLAAVSGPFAPRPPRRLRGHGAVPTGSVWASQEIVEITPKK